MPSKKCLFLSTPSARRATTIPATLFATLSYFYPRPLRGGRPNHSQALDQTHTISIHALCEEGDLSGEFKNQRLFIFLSTPSARRATLFLMVVFPLRKFLSTPSARRATRTPCNSLTRLFYFYPRPLRGGRPFHRPSAHPSNIYFYPRPLRGGRQGLFNPFFNAGVFLSTPSARRATAFGLKQLNVYLFLSTPSARRATCF